MKIEYFKTPIQGWNLYALWQVAHLNTDDQDVCENPCGHEDIRGKKTNF